jgi:hypothetical protein
MNIRRCCSADGVRKDEAFRGAIDGRLQEGGGDGDGEPAQKATFCRSCFICKAFSSGPPIKLAEGKELAVPKVIVDLVEWLESNRASCRFGHTQYPPFPEANRPAVLGLVNRSADSLNTNFSADGKGDKDVGEAI